MNLMKRPRRLCYGFISVTLFILSSSACQPVKAEVVAYPVPIQQVNSPPGDYFSVAWLSDGRFVVGYDPAPDIWKSGNQLWIMQADGSDLHMLNLPLDQQHECQVTYFGPPVALSDGRLAYERACSTVSRYVLNILVWDPQTETSQPLYTYDLPTGASRFTFSPDMSRGLLSSFTSIADELFWLDDREPSQLDVGLARANRPSWSPDGQFIVFFGNEHMPGSPGPHWASQPYDLWLIPASCRSDTQSCEKAKRRLLSNLRNAVNTAWPPDGEWLAFDGDLQGQGPGIWLMEMNTGRVFRIADGNYSGPEWSPDQQRIAVLGSPEGENYSKVFILNVSELVSK